MDVKRLLATDIEIQNFKVDIRFLLSNQLTRKSISNFYNLIADSKVHFNKKKIFKTGMTLMWITCTLNIICLGDFDISYNKRTKAARFRN